MSADDNTGGTLFIVNNYDGETAFLCQVQTDNFNCCDAPSQGTAIWVKPGQTGQIPYVKTSGHGCNGEQGVFELDLIVNANALEKVFFSFDSDANMAVTSQEGILAPTFSGTTLTIPQKSTQAATATATK
jgi:hypothetical protein